MDSQVGIGRITLADPATVEQTGGHQLLPVVGEADLIQEVVLLGTPSQELALHQASQGLPHKSSATQNGSLQRLHQSMWRVWRQ